MSRPDKTIIQNTVYIAFFSAIMSALMQAVFLVAGYWDIQVLLGNILGFIGAVGNFFLMGLTVGRAVNKEEKEARDLMRLSQTLRNMGLLIIAVIGICVRIFNGIAVIVPLFFPRIAIAVYPLIHKEGGVSK